MFRFRLQQVLQYREQLKDRARVEFARVQAELSREQERATRLQAMLVEQEARLRVAAVTDQGEHWLLEHFIRGLREDLSSTLLRVRLLAQSAEEARQMLTLRAKEHRVLEKLKEKQAQRYAQEERWKEQKSYDETAALRFKPASF